MNMADQKLENLLELSLDVSEQTREKSENLSAGYDPEEKTWEVILRYSGAVDELVSRYGAVTPLLGGYAVAVVTEAALRELSQEPMVEYIEKPKALSFAVYEGKLVSCIPPVQRAPLNLTGKGVLVAVVDSGIDIFHYDFRNEDGTTRLAGLWDQTVSTGEPPQGYQIGTYFSKEQINEILARGDRAPTVDNSGHGTHVTGIAAGNGRASDGHQRGVAYESDILVVKLGAARPDGFPQTTGLMMAVDFCVRKSLELGQPMALNLSYGNNYGPHDGTSLLETYLDSVAGIGRITICIGSGNEGSRSRHAALKLSMGTNYQIEFAVAPGEYSLGMQLWKNYADRFVVTLVAPSGESVILSENARGTYQYLVDGTDTLWYFGEPSPYSLDQEIYFELLSAREETPVTSGIWKLIITPREIAEGMIHLWLPSGGSINEDTGFLVPTADLTLTIPSTASKPVTVGAYNGDTGSFASFSGRGYRYGSYAKPDLVAPGVDIVSCSPGGGYTMRTGTSMACPFVTGSAALLMQYGIVNGRDPYLYGQKVKAYLIRGAKPLAGQTQVPDASAGWGALCLRDSVPV